MMVQSGRVPIREVTRQVIVGRVTVTAAFARGLIVILRGCLLS